MKTNSVPRQLLVFMITACTIVFAVCTMLFLMLRTAYQDSRAAADAGIAEGARGFSLLDRMASSQTALQAAVRLKDPDEIEKAINGFADSDKGIRAQLASAGASAATIQAKFDAAVAARQQAIDAFLKGDVGAANEKIMTAVNPAYGEVQTAIRAFADASTKATEARLLANEDVAWKSVVWRFTMLTLVIAAFGGYMLRTRSKISHALRKTSVELREGASHILSASQQVSTSAQDLSQGATEQAASLEETSASMEEMSAMTRKNAENAQQAAHLMTDVDARVNGANVSFGQMVESMSAIEASSEKVSKIIKTIDEIAFQTNILALNAAVEAARAGEAGMGFAVVADEVRNLAQRSAQAAKDTAVLIEESIAKAKNGTVKVEQVASSISEITQSVTKVKALVDEVSVASRQQAQGIDQVVQSITQMEKVTQTTAATAEESAAASEELNAQSETTMAVVRQIEALAGASGTEARTPAAAPSAPSASVIPLRRPAPASRRPPSAEEQIPLGHTGTFGSF